MARFGPVYDVSPVPGRRNALRDREDGAFYACSWQQVLRHRPGLVLLETWNEMHEGTELCPTRELGRQYVDLTKSWVDRLRAGAAPGPAISLRFPEPRPLPDLSWGPDAKGRAEVHADYARGERIGLREVACEDGPFRVEFGALVAGTAPKGLGSYLYFQVSDHLLFDGEADFELDVVVVADDTPRVEVEYDSRHAKATLQGAYTRARQTGTDAPRLFVRRTFALPRARFANRQNGGADFRLVLPDRAAAVREVTLRRL